ncbi:RIIB lysis inhibitor [Escherichia phage vB_EcoM_VR26]|uniref:Protector from prophage-induced early lysis n=1 Tax=Escherichia phage vB_EcoM_VR26 TaxID=1567029 RepID=A0A0A7HDZ9_9CAUD|nr:RIIB lysis inhibitor [Escherichia phage vB_EcoM_VR26]AIZ02928.1 protector from prophage-induced early lysis [Escherichia phage vB_EcoM_VR26]
MYNIKCVSEYEQKQIVSLYASGNYTQQELADWYNISVDTIRRVLKNDKEFKPSEVVITRNITVTVPNEPQVVPVTDTIGGSRPEIVWNASSKFVSITEGRTVWNATKDHKHFDAIIQALKESRFDDAIEFISIKAAVQKYVKGDVRIEGGSLFYQGIELRSGLVTRIINSMQNGEDFEFYLPFLENLLENPSEKAVQRLFDFLVANDIEITEDGHFIAWKMVRSTYKDCHSNTFDNSPGQYVKMPRSRVNDNDEQTCSTGLHVCSKGYIGSGFGHGDGRIVSCKVHPRDVVSIPVDYGDSKMRVCGYLVLDDVTEQF